MSIDVLNRVLASKTTRLAERLVMIALADRADEYARCFPSRSDIADRANVRVDAVDDILARLVEMGELVILKKIGTSNEYIVATGLTPEQVSTCTRKAWHKSLREVVATNEIVAGKLGQSKGQNLNPQSGTLRVNPQSGTLSPPLEGNPGPPQSGTLREPSVTINLTLTGQPAPKLDPLQHAFDWLVKNDKDARAIMRAKGSDDAKRFAVLFLDATHLYVGKAKEWVSGAQELYEACSGDWTHAALAIKKLKADKLTIASPRSIVKTAASFKAQAQEHKEKNGTTNFAPVFN